MTDGHTLVTLYYDSLNAEVFWLLHGFNSVIKYTVAVWKISGYEDI